MAATGSPYTYVSKAFGPSTGMFTSTSLQLAYGFISVFALASSVDHVGLAVHRSTGWAPPPWASAVLVLALAGAVGTLIVREISLALRILLIIEAATAGVVLVLTLVLLVNLYLRGQMDWSLLALHQATPKNVGAGAAVVMTAFVGFESSTAIGAEARRPFRDVPRALVWTVVAGGALYFLAASAQVAAVGMLDIPAADGGSARP
ncbi:amino acid permease [Streptomyces sp. NPDC048385]